MTRAVIVHINVDDGYFDPTAIAEDVADACSAAGLDVVSAAMWAAPTLAGSTLPMQQTPALSTFNLPPQ